MDAHYASQAHFTKLGLAAPALKAKISLAKVIDFPPLLELRIQIAALRAAA